MKPKALQRIGIVVAICTFVVGIVGILQQANAAPRIIASPEPLGDVVFDEGFEGSLDGNWSLHRKESLGVGGWAVTDSRQYAGAKSIFHDDNFEGQDDNVLNEMDSWLVSKQIQLSAESELTFYTLLRHSTVTGTHEVWVSTGSAIPKDNDFKLVKTLPISPHGQWVSDTIPLGQFAGQEAAIAFRYRGTFADEWYLDAIMLTGGFAAANDSPTLLGNPTVFQAHVGSGTDVTYSWDMGDGSPPVVTTEKVVTHTYAAAGTYDVRVSAENSVSSAAAQTTARVESPITGLTASNNGPNSPNTTTTLSAAVATGTDILYEWAFGDGQTMTTTSATIDHVYTQTGLYTATVHAANSGGGMTATTNVIVETGIAGLELHHEPATRFGKETVVTVTITSGTNVSYTIDFGDGTTQSDRWLLPYRRQRVTNTPLTAQFTATHYYENIGDHTITVDAINLAGAVQQQSPIAIDVEPGRPLLMVDFEPNNKAPNWAPYLHQLGGSNWQTTTTKIRSASHSAYHDDSPGAQDSWLVTAQVTPTLGSELVFWEFVKYAAFSAERTIHLSTGSGDPKDGDFMLFQQLDRGLESAWAEQRFDLADYIGQPIYIGFRYKGNFSDEWYVDDIYVTGPAFAYNSSTTELGDATHFTATVPLGTRLTYDWDYGESSSGSGQYPSHTYAQGGVYTATVTMSNSVGQITATTVVTIQTTLYMPVIFNDFTSAPDLVVSSVQFTGTEVAIVVRNVGTRAVTDPFWVDLLVNPQTPPLSVNDTLETLNATGLVWAVGGDGLPLQIGETLTLTRNDRFFDDDRSNFAGPFLSGANVYVHVDSANTADGNGGVRELHEIRGESYNNIKRFIVP